MNTILKKISTMDGDEIEMLIDAIKTRRNILAQAARITLNVGDVVQFDTGKRAGIIQGTIIKKKIKNVVVKPFGPATGNWNVTASLLTKVAA